MTFEQWMHEVDVIIAGKAMGLTSSDLADIDYWSLWNDEAEPMEAAKEALLNDGYPSELL